MEKLNFALYLLINASADAPVWVIRLAKFCAGGLIFWLPLQLVFGWVRGTFASRLVMLEVLLACLSGLLISSLIGNFWPHSRPFVLELGRTLLAHAPDASFPSDHTVILAAAAASFWLQGWRRSGGLLVVLTLVTGWARIYVGVHFPFDILGGLALGLCCAWFCRRFASRLVAVLLPCAQRLYGFLLFPLIRLGWFLP